MLTGTKIFELVAMTEPKDRTELLYRMVHDLCMERDELVLKLENALTKPCPVCVQKDWDEEKIG